MLIILFDAVSLKSDKKLKIGSVFEPEDIIALRVEGEVIIFRNSKEIMIGAEASILRPLTRDDPDFGIATVGDKKYLMLREEEWCEYVGQYGRDEKDIYNLFKLMATDAKKRGIPLTGEYACKTITTIKCK